MDILVFTKAEQQYPSAPPSANEKVMIGMSNMLNAVLMLLCIAVLVQTARLMRSIRAIRSIDFKGTIVALDKSSEEARQVIQEMKEALSGCVLANKLALSKSQDLRDELSFMSDLANSSADRVIEAVEQHAGMRFDLKTKLGI
jgi:hypothetical protein